MEEEERQPERFTEAVSHQYEFGFLDRRIRARIARLELEQIRTCYSRSTGQFGSDRPMPFLLCDSMYPSHRVIKLSQAQVLSSRTVSRRKDPTAEIGVLEHSQEHAL